jgi:hypothetical protein
LFQLKLLHGDLRIFRDSSREVRTVVPLEGVRHGMECLLISGRPITQRK